MNISLGLGGWFGRGGVKCFASVRTSVLIPRTHTKLTVVAIMLGS